MRILLPNIPEAERTPLVQQLLDIIALQQERIQRLEDQVRLQQERIRERPVEYIFKMSRASPIIRRGQSTRLGEIRRWRSPNRAPLPGRT